MQFGNKAENHGENHGTLKISGASPLSIDELEATIRHNGSDTALYRYLQRLAQGHIYIDTPEKSLTLVGAFSPGAKFEMMQEAEKLRMVLSLVFCLQEFVQNGDLYTSTHRSPEEYNELRNAQQKITDMSEFIIGNLHFDTDNTPYFKETIVPEEYFSEVNIHALLVVCDKKTRSMIQNIGALLQQLLGITNNSAIDWKDIFSKVKKAE